MEKLSISENIRILCKREGVTLTELAHRLGMSPQNLGDRLRRDDFRISDLERIADALGYFYKWDFIKNPENLEK